MVNLTPTGKPPVTVGIVGFGYMGASRLAAIRNLQMHGAQIEVVGIVDPALSSTPDGVRRLSLDALLDEAPAWIVVATPHAVAAGIACRALISGCQVLLEKPMGIEIEESKRLNAAQVYANQLKIGLNYRFFEGIRSLLSDINSGAFGNLSSVSVSMGHGHAPGLERSWKLDPDQAGSGVLLDPGIHIMHLLQLISQHTKVTPICGLSARPFWLTGIDEEIHLILSSDAVPLMNVQLSLVRWRSTFRLEVWGDAGYGIVEGRGRTYGPQVYRRGKRWQWTNGRPQRETEEVVSTSDCDNVFEMEMAAALGLDPSQQATGANEALLAMELIDTCQGVLMKT